MPEDEAAAAAVVREAVVEIWGIDRRGGSDPEPDVPGGRDTRGRSNQRRSEHNALHARV
jgi:hypothetical protein